MAPVRGTRGRSFVPILCEGFCQSYTLIAGECWGLDDKLTGCSFVPLRNLWSGHNFVSISCKRAAEQKCAQALPQALQSHLASFFERAGRTAQRAHRDFSEKANLGFGFIYLGYCFGTDSKTIEPALNAQLCAVGLLYFTTHKSKPLKNERVRPCGICSRTLPIRSRALRGHYKGTKNRLGHYRGQHVSTGENGKSMENALVSTKLKRVEKVYTHVRDVGAASSNLVTSTIENARSFGRFPVAACFVLSGGKRRLGHYEGTKSSKSPCKVQQNSTKRKPLQGVSCTLRRLLLCPGFRLCGFCLRLFGLSANCQHTLQHARRLLVCLLQAMQVLVCGFNVPMSEPSLHLLQTNTAV